MIRNPAPLSLALLALLSPMALASCSVVVDVKLPKTGEDSNCAFLNEERDQGVTECMRWQFNPDTLICEVVRLDQDDDGFSPRACLDEGVITADEVDCNDDPSTGALAAPGADELCDGVDNDCDTKVDEGALVPDLSPSPTVMFSAAPNDVAYAVDGDANNSVGIAYVLPGVSSVPGVVLRDRGIASESADRFSLFTAKASNEMAERRGDNTVLGESIGIASLGANQYAVAFVNQSGGRRLVAGVAKLDQQKRLFVETTIFDSGLACSPTDGNCTLVRPPMDKPLVGVSGTDVLVTILRRSMAENECASDVSEVAVVGSALKKQDFMRVTLPSNAGQITFPALRTTANNPEGIDLGFVRGDASPAVIGIPGLGFVLALPQVDNTIILRRITITGGVYAIGDDLVLSVGNDDEALLEPAFALSEAVDSDDDGTNDSYSLALAFRSGCGGTGNVRVQMINVNLETGALSRAGNAREIDGQGLSNATSESRPSIGFAPDQGNTWFVSYAKQRNLRARVLSFDGTPYGSADCKDPAAAVGCYTLIEDAERIGLAPATFQLPTGSFDSPRFGAMVDATIGGDNGIYTARLGCFESSN